MTAIFLLFFLGLFLACCEIFLPGGVLGTLGILCILGSLVYCYLGEGAQVGTYFLLFSAGATALGLWFASRVFPQTRLGKSITLQSDQKGFKANAQDAAALLHKTGTALSYLRPAGIATIDGQRWDVATEGTFVPKGEKIRVIRVEGNRVVVEKEQGGSS